MLQAPFQEVSRRSFLINKYDEITLSWHNSIITVRTHKGISFLQFTYNLECLDKKLDFLETSIPTTKSSPAAGLLSHCFITSGVSNYELSRLVVEPRFWPHNPQIVKEMACILTCDWSPIDLIHNGVSVLAVLNNIGNVDFFESQNNVWVNVLDLSPHVNMNLDVALPHNMTELENALNAIESCAICWAPKLNSNRSCYFITAQNNGNLLLWVLKENNMKLSAEYQGYIESDAGEILTMLWIEKGDDIFLLILSNSCGQIFALDCKIEKKFILLNKYTLWSCKDKMLTQHLYYTRIDNKIILFCNKYRHFLALLLDENYNVVSQYINNINDHRVTVITNSIEGYFVGTINCKIYKIDFCILNNNLDVRFNLIETKDMYPAYELHSLQFSENCSLCAMALLDRRVYIRKGSPNAEVLFFTKNTNTITEMSYILNNPVKKIISLWDCIEMIRYKIVKFKTLHDCDLKALIEDGNIDAYKLKVYLIIAKIWSSLEKNMIVYRGLLPDSAIDRIQDKIILSHALSQIRNLHKKYMKGGNLNNFETETFNGTKKFLELYCTKYNKNIQDLVPSEVLETVKTNYSYVCQCCDDEIDGFSCKNGHLNMFCSITFTPIESPDYLICTKCQVTARTELYPDKPMCIFCDKYLSNDVIS